MTVNEIRNEAQLYVDDTIEDADAVAAVNAALSDLGDMALVYDNTEIKVTRPDWEIVDDDKIHVVEVLDSDGKPYTKYQERGENIYIPDLGTYTVWYRRLPKRVSTVTETPEIHRLFHECLVTFLEYWWKKKDDDESQDAELLYQKYKADATRAFSSLARRRVPSTVKVVR
jgi:hypothetical protein